MKSKKWDSIEVFLTENKLEFTHVETDEQYQQELKNLEQENQQVISMLSGGAAANLSCRKWRPVKRRICRWVGGKYECVEHTNYVCVDR